MWLIWDSEGSSNFIIFSQLLETVTANNHVTVSASAVWTGDDCILAFSTKWYDIRRLQDNVDNILGTKPKFSVEAYANCYKLQKKRHAYIIIMYHGQLDF